ncbi:MAG: prepilin-type N-terminal cleavage/methylation domain-containing protein [Phycisphaerae bacterium]|jgi:prepilin-type N-terminal cleavage/methylation domain-containing protein
MKMENKKRQSGFSLVEVLMAVGILTVGLILVATMFPAAIFMTTVASERTMAAIVADEAFAKIQIYDMNGIAINKLNDPCSCYDWGKEKTVAEIADSEFAYPPVDPNGGSSQYFWSALYKKKNNIAEDREFQITVFVARRMNSGLDYVSSADDGNGGKRPVPYNITGVSGSRGSPTMTIGGNLVNPPITIVDNETGKLYTVVKRDNTGVTLDRNLEDDISSSTGGIWVIPPPTSGGKNAGVEVYQRIIKF